MLDEEGHLVAVLMAKVRGLPDAFYGEVQAIKEWLHLIQEVRPEKIIIELDAITLTNALINNREGESEVAFNVKHIQSFIQTLPWWRLNHASGKENQFAHGLHYRKQTA